MSIRGYGESFRVYRDGVGNAVVMLLYGGYPVRSLIIPEDGGTPLTEALRLLKSDSVPTYLTVMGPADSFRFSARRDPVSEIEGGVVTQYGRCGYVDAYLEARQEAL